MIKKLAVAIFFFLTGSAFGQTGVCMGTANQGTPCTSDSACTGDVLNSCVTIKHVVFIIKENRSFDHLFGQFPGTTAVCSGGTNAGAACIAPNDATSQCSGGGTCPFITTAKCYNDNNAHGGCPAASNSQGTMNMIAGNPNLGDIDCGHVHSNIAADYHSGAMDKFNWSCGTSTDWAKQYNSATIPHYWSYAQTYGLADHMRSSAMAPSMPSHMIFFLGTTTENSDNPALVAGATGHGVPGNGWNLDAYHNGICTSGRNLNGQCSTSSDCGGGTCALDLPTGKCCTQGKGCDFASAATCTRNSDCNTSESGTITISSATPNIVTGSGTNFTSSWVGSILYVNRGGSGTVASVQSGTQLTLLNPYPGSTYPKSAGFTMGLQFCSNGNSYEGTWFGIDLLGGPGAAGGNTGHTLYPGLCTNSGAEITPPISCVRTCSALNCSATGAIDDPACTASGYTCGVRSGSDLLAGSRANIGANVTTIGDLLNAAGVSWGEYYPIGEERRAGMSYVPHHRYGTDWTYKYHTYPANATTQFVTDAAACTSDVTCTCATNQTSRCLPSVVWIEAGPGNEHPTGTVAQGESWSATQVNAVLNNSYLYRNTLIFLWWDDFGGFYDHMAPTVDGQNWRNGFRVPLLCIGKYCKNQVTHTEFTFESLLTMVENLFISGTRLPGSLYDSTANDIGMGCLQGTTNCTGHTETGMVDLTMPH